MSEQKNKFPFEIGTIYDDPQGVYQVVDFDDKNATIVSIQKDANHGNVYEVPVDEVIYFVEHPYVDRVEIPYEDDENVDTDFDLSQVVANEA